MTWGPILKPHVFPDLLVGCPSVTKATEHPFYEFLVLLIKELKKELGSKLEDNFIIN